VRDPHLLDRRRRGHERRQLVLVVAEREAERPVDRQLGMHARRLVLEQPQLAQALALARRHDLDVVGVDLAGLERLGRRELDRHDGDVQAPAGRQRRRDRARHLVLAGLHGAGRRAGVLDARPDRDLHRGGMAQGDPEAAEVRLDPADERTGENLGQFGHFVGEPVSSFPGCGSDPMHAPRLAL
jgi:hypothetical protein